MAISLTSSNDILFKKYITSQSTTDNRRAYFEEPYPSQPNVFPNSIWLQADQIPTTAATVIGITEFVSLTMSYVPGSNGSFYSPILVDLIPFNYGPGYNFGVFRNNGTTSIVLGESDWLIDPNAGVITFFSGALNGTVSSTVTTGQVIASPASPPVVKAWKYIGKKGIIPNLSGLTYSGGTMSVLLGQGLTFSNGQVITTLSTLGAGVGLTFSSPTFSVQLSQSSGLTVSQSGLGVNIGTGLTVSNGRLGTLITTSAGLGLTSSGNTFSIQVSQDSGLTLSQSGLSIVDSLKIGSTSVTIDGDVIGRYSQDPIGNSYWGPLSIPTKSYVDSIAAGLDLKESVRVAATGSISLTQSPAQVDGITLSFGDRLLLWRQDNTSNGTSSNGIYVFGGAGLGLTRSSDFDGNPNSEVKTGAYVFVTDGITYQGSGFVLVSSGTSSGNILVGTESQKWTRFNSTTNYQWGRGIDISGDTINIQLGLNSGLSFSQTGNDGGLKIETIPNSGLTIDQSGLGISSTISGMGLTFNGGQLQLTNPSFPGRGITFTNQTYSIDIDVSTFTFSGNSISINPNIVGIGLTYSGGTISVNIGSGLTVSGGQIGALNTVVSGLGLTNSGNTFSINLSNNSGLTLSNSGLSINAVGFGLTLSNNSLSNSLVSGNGITISSSGIVSTRVDNLTGLYNNNGLNYIGWEYFLGSGLTWSGTQLNTTTSAIRKFGNTYSFTTSLPTTVTHNLATTDIIIQMYEISTGEEVLAQYTNRQNNSVDITTFNDVTARVIIIG